MSLALSHFRPRWRRADRVQPAVASPAAPALAAATGMEALVRRYAKSIAWTLVAVSYLLFFFLAAVYVTWVEY